MLVVRPLSIWVCTLGSELNWQEKVFAAWLAPRGIVAASVSSLFALVLTERNVTGGEAVKALVFLTIALTVILQGLSAAWLARWLELKSGGVTVIVGDNIVGRQLAEFLRDRAQAVALIHHVPSASENLASENLATSPTLDFEQEGSNEFEPTEILTTIVGNALDESVLLQAHLERADRLVVLTENAEVNQAIAELALKTYDPPHIVAALNPEVSASEEIETIPFSCATLEQWMTSVPPEGVQVKPLQLPLQDAANEPECTVRLVVSDRPSVYPAPEVNSSLNDLRTPPTVSANDFMRLMDDLGDRSQSAQLLPLSLRRKQGYLLFPDVGQWQPGDEIAFLERTSSQVTLVYKPHKGNTRPADIPGTPPLHASPRNRFAWQFAPEQ
jgi:voltage-gated potassium channel Kch